MSIYNISYGFGRKQDSKKLHKLTFCSCFFWFMDLGGKLVRCWCFCRHFRLKFIKALLRYMMTALGAQAQAAGARAAMQFPILIAADAVWETLRSTERQINIFELMVEYLVACGLRHPSDRTQTTICALLTKICISWVPGLILDFSGGYVRFGYKRVCVWMQYHKKSNKRICVWWQESMYMYVFDA